MQLLKIWIPVLLAAAALLAACSDEVLSDDLPGKEDAADGNIYIRFRMNLSGSGLPGFSRAAETERSDTPTTPDEPETTKTPREEAIESILILAYDAETGILVDKIKIGDTNTISLITGNDGYVIPVYSNKTRKLHIYAAANLPERMECLFIVGKTEKNAFFTYQNSQKALSNYCDVINEIVPGTDGLQQNLEKNTGTIPMTGQFKTRGENSSYDITVTDKNNTAETAVPITADVSRIVAKIHVLVNCDESLTKTVTDPVTNEVTNTKEIKYVNSYSNYVSDDSKTGQIGWILSDDVRYYPNGTNKSTYIFSKTDDKDKPVDLNMYLDSYVATTYSSSTNKFGFNAILWSNDFSFSDGLSLHKENISDKSHFSKAEPFYETKYNNTKANTDGGYTRGMYCLENYFYNPSETNAESFKNYTEAIPVVTHVSIAAKLLPRWIVIESDFATQMQKFIEEYTTGKETFLKNYGVTEKDFDEDDAARWDIINNYYFTGNSAYFHRAKGFQFIEAQSKEDAADIIKWSLIINNMYSSSPNDFENGRYPEGTYFTYERGYIPTETETETETKPDTEPTEEYPQRYLYLTAGAFNKATGDISYVKTYSVPHIGGWCYYFTYLDQLGQATNGKTPYTSSQVTRNTYYLLNVVNFGFPGGSISRPEYIKVNTETIEWDYEGRGDITLH